MKILTAINNFQNFYFNLLKLSCAVSNLELVVLHTTNNFRSRRVKDDLLREYLEHEADDQVVLFSDGFDVVFVSQEDEILSKFYKMGKDLIFSAETGCWPDRDLASSYPQCESKYRFLNSGGFIGKVKTIKKLLNDHSFDVENYDNSNQYLWTKRFFKYRSIIGLDTNCEIFCTFSPEVGYDSLPKRDDEDFREYYIFMKNWFYENFTAENGRILNKITGTWPCQLHFNGHSKYILDEDIINLIYSQIPGYKPSIYYTV